MNRFRDETGIGIVTCNRPEYCHTVIESISDDVGEIVVLNAGDNFDFKFEDSQHLDKISEVLRGTQNPMPVGHAKNKLLRHMRHSGKTYIFLIEDDVRIKDNTVFQRYIETAADTGLWCGQLCYGSHGGKTGGNVLPSCRPNVKQTVDYDNFSIDLYPQSFQAFTLYHSNSIKVLGYMDERFLNAAEHLDHYFKAFRLGVGNYFWNFPDIESSWDYIEDIDTDHEGSVIRKSDEWHANMQRGWALFKTKWGAFPTDIPQVSPEEVLKRLEFIETHYSQKNLLNEATT